MPWLINAIQLDKFRKNQKNIVVLDASWHLPEENRHAKEEFLAKHIPSARFLDLNAFTDQDSNLPNMLMRDEKLIAEKIGALGISKDHKIIFYDNSKLHSSCRALWMFKVFGHNPNQLYILDGGLLAWEQFKAKTEEGETKASVKSYTVTFEAHFIRTLVQMKTNIHHPTEQVVDVRHPSRFIGGKEIRPGLRAGHIPGSFSFPYMTMFESNGRWKPIEKIRRQLTSIGVELDYPIITTCGSGMSCPTLNFALDLMGQEKNSVYDGSFAEWGAECLYSGEDSLAERPVETCLEN